MKNLLLLLALLASLSGANAANHASTGYSKDTTIIRSDPEWPCYGTLNVHHDSSFEDGFCWMSGGVVPGTTYGAFGESFAVSSYFGVVCVCLWVTQTGDFSGQTLDLYMWEGGISGPPGVVLGVLVGQALYNVPYWPTVGQNDLFFGRDVHTDFTVGYWADFSASPCGWYLAADQDGFGGHPWTNIAPGTGYPTGWQRPDVVWSACQSLGIGAVDGMISPVESATWGQLKQLLR